MDHTRYNKKIRGGTLVSVLIESFTRVPARVVHTGAVYFQPTLEHKNRPNITSSQQ